MKRTVLLWSFLAIVTLLVAQEPLELRPCATVDGTSDWLVKYQQNPAAFAKNLDSILYIPLTIHVVGTDGGGGFFSLDNTLDALCTLNADFAPSNIQFYIKNDIRYHKNSAYYNHETILEGAAMMFAENVPNTINCYIVNNPTGACGYNLPYAGITIAKSCNRANDHTWAHEIGHAFRLPHPFLGWESGISYSDTLGITHSFSNPAPTQVLYDYTLFKDSLITDTIIIDTALVEYVDGRNCAIAGDGFCDTPPDYLYFRWQCDGTSSTLEQTDPDGVKFRSDATLFMSYAADDCQNRFSDEQIAAMRANILDRKSYLLGQDTLGTAIPPQAPIVLAPGEGEEVSFQNIRFEWNAVPGAEQYIFQLSRLPSLGFPEVDTMVAENFIEIPELRNNTTFYWRIRPLNKRSFCTAYSDVRSFGTTTITSTEDLQSERIIKVFPNPVRAGEPMQVHFPHVLNKPAHLQIWNATGQLVWAQSIQSGLKVASVQTRLPRGFYTIGLKAAGILRVGKLIIR